jgi:hypothetical protein
MALPATGGEQWQSSVGFCRQIASHPSAVKPPQPVLPVHRVYSSEWPSWVQSSEFRTGKVFPLIHLKSKS